MSSFAALRVYDNGGETFDRYTVVFSDGSVLGIGETGNVPNGFCMHVGSIYDEGGSRVDEGPHLGELVEIGSLPSAVQSAVENELALHARLLALYGNEES